MDIIQVAESHFRSLMNEYAFEISSCIQNQEKDGSYDRLILNIGKYENAMSKFNVIQNVKSQLAGGEDSGPKEENNESD